MTKNKNILFMEEKSRTVENMLQITGVEYNSINAFHYTHTSTMLNSMLNNPDFSSEYKRTGFVSVNNDGMMRTEKAIYISALLPNDSIYFYTIELKS